MEEQLNDLTELHQNETGNLKLELASIEEKMAYQANERARDIQVQTDTKTLTYTTNIKGLILNVCKVLNKRNAMPNVTLCSNQMQRDKAMKSHST